MIALGKIKFITLILLLIICVSRGVLELFISQTVSYLIQASSLIAIFIITLTKRPFWVKTGLQDIFLTLYLIIITFTSSLLFSINTNGIISIAILGVNLLNILFLFYALIFVKCGDSFLTREQLNKIIYILSLYVSCGFYLEFLGFIEFSGGAVFDELLRAGGTLGSKQHLSLVLSVLSVSLLDIFISKKSPVPFFILSCTVLALFMTFTRIGYLYFALMVFLWFVLGGYYDKFKININRIILSLLAIFLSSFVLYFVNFEIFESIKARLLMIDLSEYSNQIRFKAWFDGLKAFSDGCIYFSCDMGEASQISGKLTGIPKPHYESGQLQILINFGLFGWIAYSFLYVLPFYWKLRAKEACLFLVTYICLFIYMFNEVVPFFVLFLFVTLSITYSRSNGIEIKAQESY